MPSELERLLLTFEADTRKLRAALADADTSVATFERKADASLGRAAKKFGAFESAAVGALKSVGAAIVAQLAISKLSSAIDETAGLAKTATLAGITAVKLQELRAAARDAGLANGELDSVMGKFAVTMGEFRGRQGDFYKFLREQLPSVEAQLRATKSQGEAFDVVAETVRRLQSAEDRALFTKKALGEASTLLVNKLSDGRQGLIDSAEAAKKYAGVLDDDAIKATVELKKEIDNVSNALSVGLQKSIAAAAPALTTFLKEARGYFSKSGFLGLNPILFPVEMLRQGRQRAMEAAKAQGEGSADAFIGAWKTTVDRNSDKLKIQPHIPDFTTEIDFAAADALSELARKHAEAVGDSGELIRLEYDKEVEAFRRMLAEQKISEADYQLARQQLSVAMGAKIRAAYDEETKHVREALDSVKSTIENSLSKPLDDLLRTGKVNFRELVADMIAQLAKLAVQATIIKPALDALLRPGTGAGDTIGNLLAGAGSLFGGARAGGGSVNARTPYLVGERGPELFVPNTSGRIDPRGGAAAAGGNTYVINAQGSEIGVEERIRAVVLEMERNRPGAAVSVAKAHARFPTRRAA